MLDELSDVRGGGVPVFSNGVCLVEEAITGRGTE